MATDAKDILRQTFWRTPEMARQRVTLKELRAIYLEYDNIMACGHLWEIQNKRVCPGIYEVWLTRRKYGESAN